MALSGSSIPHASHLEVLLARLDALAERLRASTPTDDEVAAARRRTVQASLALDGADVDDATVERVLAAAAPEGAADSPPPGRSTWLDTLRVDIEDVDPHVRALEIHGVAATHASHDLSGMLRTDPHEALAALHARLTAGLVTPARAGRPRTVEQAVHDGATGRILYFTTDPERIDDELAGLCRWLQVTDEPPAVVAAMLHLELLRIHPFDAANGRLARAASSLVLVDAGLDPHRLAGPEPVLATDPLGYHQQVAGALRARHPERWLEYYAESVEAGLIGAGQPARSAARPSARAAEFLHGWSEPSFTITDYCTATSTSATDARVDLEALLDAGEVRRVRGSAGLRFTR